MGINIEQNSCNGCGFPEHETPCNMACPGDLIFMQSNGKAQITCNADCWDCCACIKICPQQAIELVLPLEIVGKKGSLKARAYREKTVWATKNENGDEEIFETPARRGDACKGEITSSLLNPEEFSDCIDAYKGISKSFVDLGQGI